MKTFSLSNAQLRMITTELRNPGTTAYLIPIKFCFKKEHSQYIKNALKLVTQGNLLLRIGKNKDMEFYQYYADFDESCISEYDVTKLSTKELTALKLSLSKLSLPKLFDSPLYKYEILYDKAEVEVYMTVSHHVFDYGTAAKSFAIRLNEAIKALSESRSWNAPSEDYDIYIKAENDYLNSDKAETEIKYWLESLADTDEYPETIQLTNSMSLSTKEINLPDSMTQGLLKFKDAKGKVLSPFILAMGILSVYIARSNRSKGSILTIGCSARDYDDEIIKEMIGMLVNVLPLNFKYKPDLTVTEMLMQVKDVLKNGLTHGNAPINKYSNDLNKLSVDVNSLFNYSVVSNAVLLNDAVFSMQLGYFLESEFPLTVRVNVNKDDKKGLQSLRFEYRNDCFTDSQIEMMTSNILRLVEDMLSNPQKKCKDLSIVSESVEKKLLFDLQGKKLEYNTNQTIIDLLKHHAATSADSIAVNDAKNVLTYRDLDNYTDSFAVKLQAEGVANEDFVAVMLPRAKEFALAIISVMKASAAYVPVDYSYPPDRIQYMIKDSGAKVLITTKDIYYKLNIETQAKLLFIEDFVIDNLKPTSLPKINNLAYMIYTSGSTGNPKGVMIEHKSATAMCVWAKEMYNLKPGKSLCCYASFSFDASVIDIFPSIYSGCTLHILNDELRFNMDKLNEYIAQHSINGGCFPTKFGMEFFQEYSPEIEFIFIGGEKLKQLPKRKTVIINGYGPTEFTVASSYHIVNQDKNYSNIPIGKPVPNSYSYVLDENMHLVPVGTPGELVLSGIQISRGYFNRKELTAEKFVPNPFTDNENNKMSYRTGDLVCWNEDGELEFLGRIDTQVKLRGFRIELGEIETALNKFESITNSVAIVKNDSLISYFTAKKEIDTEALRLSLSEKMPAYMVPSFFIQLTEFPMTPGGKIDVKKLPVPEHKELLSEEIIVPESETEKVLFNIISKVLRHSDFGVTSNLFQAGMSSLDAIKIASRISDNYSISYNAQNIMTGKTIRAIERSLLKENISEIKQYKIQDEYPLTQSQMGVYYECAKDPKNLKYNIPFILRLSPETDALRLKEAVTSVLSKHPFINTNLCMKAQQVRQKRNDGQTVVVESLQGSEEDLQKFINSFIKPFQLFTGRLYRVYIYTTKDSVNLIADFHHLIFDGASVDILLRQIQVVYSGKEILAEKFSSFEMSLDEQEIEKSDKYKQAESYFSQAISKCDGATVLAPDKNGDENEGCLCQEAVEISATKIISVCKQHGITSGSFFLAAISYCISRFTNSKDILISTISNGRSDTKYDNAFGMFVKTLPLVINIDTSLSIKDYLIIVQESLFSTISHECYPFTKVFEKFKFSPQLMYAFQSGVVSGFKINNQEYKIETLELKKPKFKLSIHVEDSENNFRIAVQYNDALYSKKYMQTLAESCQIAVESFISDTAKRLSGVSLLSQKHTELILLFNQTQGDLPVQLLHNMFENIVNQKPDSPALITATESLTYQELNEKANAIAWSLLDKGLKTEDRVAFMLPRDSRLIATMLGIVKAGGAYIPIDPQYPIDRINHVLNDSKAKFIISDNLNLHIDTDNLLSVDDLLINKNKLNPVVSITPENLCYLIYTSGSTGTPKGVMLTHKGICNYVYSHPYNRHVYELANQCQTMLSITTVSFDMFLKESFTTLMNGLTLAFASDEQSQNPVELTKFFRHTKADAFNATPSRMSQYLQSAELKEEIAKCKVLMAGGESFPVTLYNQLAKLSDAVIFNTYGPTEITVSSNAKKLTDANITIGAPLLNVQEYVMDSDANPLPLGVTGELYIGGFGVARGYWNNQEKTNEKFKIINKERLYQTGDYARWTDNGEILILGRTDNQIKLRGLRIELGEIEAAVSSFPEIISTVVTIRKIQNNDHICAYYIANSNIKIEELREHLTQKLTKYMIPTAYMQLQKFPVTPNGKTDLKSLPEPVMMTRNEYIEPVNETEKTFCEIFQSVLGISKVGALDNFFDLGGTSLQVTQVTIDAMNAGYEISYGAVFTNPSPREIADLLIKRKSEQAEKPSLKIYNRENRNINKQIDDILQQNTIESFEKSERRPIGNLLLTGATGFLGIHVLKSFLENETGLVYCLMRKGRQESPEVRLKALLVYYFDNSFDDLFNTRIFVVEGDITSSADFSKLDNYPIDTVINCAANVKHYAADNQISDINVLGVKNGIDFSFKKACRYIQISTTSVAGLSVENTPPSDSKFDEKTLFIGQNMVNKYIQSKYDAEKLVLMAISHGLDAKIMRVGNLMARNKDGEFQINFNTNGFINRLKAYYAIGCISYQAMANATELAPIDTTADAIILLSSAPSACCLFHPYNYHYIFISDIIKIMNKQGLNINTTDEKTFQKCFSEAMKDKERAVHLAGIIAYLNMGNGKRVSFIHTVNDYTAQILYRYNFQWPITSDDYLNKFIVSLKELGFFDWQDMNV